MSATSMATQTAVITRSPSPTTGNIVSDQTSHLTGLSMVLPMPVSSEVFLAHPAYLASPRKTFETFVFAANDGGYADLPDITDGDKLAWVEQSKSYIIKGVELWGRDNSGLFDGRSYAQLLLEEVQIA